MQRKVLINYEFSMYASLQERVNFKADSRLLKRVVPKNNTWSANLVPDPSQIEIGTKQDDWREKWLPIAVVMAFGVVGLIFGLLCYFCVYKRFRGRYSTNQKVHPIKVQPPPTMQQEKIIQQIGKGLIKSQRFMQSQASLEQQVKTDALQYQNTLSNEDPLDEMRVIDLLSTSEGLAQKSEQYNEQNIIMVRDSQNFMSSLRYHKKEDFATTNVFMSSPILVSYPTSNRVTNRLLIPPPLHSSSHNPLGGTLTSTPPPNKSRFGGGKPLFMNKLAQRLSQSVEDLQLSKEEYESAGQYTLDPQQNAAMSIEDEDIWKSENIQQNALQQKRPTINIEGL
ncbi:hypothetical protein FGO68_gene2369 [Halteria grandinella]|uniref:Uncharacterized protein n=1 Tax=Halteria grandinella TaxID=5974 RepID=A0A8J8SZU9_HALGN|nr:hypothetical protein FGO68_gene2369 [Halteria grandinella]